MRIVHAASEFERGAGLGPARGEGLLRRRPRAGREVPDLAAAHRDPGVRRHPRQRGAPVRARLLGAAPPPEGARGGAGAGHDGGASPRDGRGRGRRGAGDRLRRRGHGGVHRRAGRHVLLHGDEHAAAGRASGDRDGHRTGPRRMATAGRCRRAAAARAAGAHALGPRDRGAALRRGPGPRLPAVDRHDPALAHAGDGRARARRHGLSRRRRGEPVLRPDARQAHRVGRGSRRGLRRAVGGARRVRGRGRGDQRRAARAGGRARGLRERSRRHRADRQAPRRALPAAGRSAGACAGRRGARRVRGASRAGRRRRAGVRRRALAVERLRRLVAEPDPARRRSPLRRRRCAARDRRASLRRWRCPRRASGPRARRHLDQSAGPSHDRRRRRALRGERGEGRRGTARVRARGRAAGCASSTRWRTRARCRSTRDTWRRRCRARSSPCT